jgi:hypothetical protein
MKETTCEKKWEVTICPTATVHVHYETGSPEILQDGFRGLARELRDVANQLDAMAEARKEPRE